MQCCPGYSCFVPVTIMMGRPATKQPVRPRSSNSVTQRVTSSSENNFRAHMPAITLLKSRTFDRLRVKCGNAAHFKLMLRRPAAWNIS